jgi:predicted butyrate kinase (DUF1464 family)
MKEEGDTGRGRKKTRVTEEEGMNEEEAEWEELFELVAQTVAEWRRKHPRAKLTEIEKAVDRQLAEVRVKMVEDLAQRGETADIRQLAEAERPRCPACGRAVVANGKQKRRLRTDHEQTIELERSKAYCPHCQVSFFPSG